MGHPHLTMASLEAAAEERKEHMTFIDTDELERQRPYVLNTLIGPQDGATRLFLLRGTHTRGMGAGLHRHGGEEAIRVMSGELRVRIGDETRVCSAGDIAFILPQTEHGYVVLSEEAVIEVIGEQHVGSSVKILDADGSSHEVEVFTKEILADHEPPEGTTHTPSLT